MKHVYQYNQLVTFKLWHSSYCTHKHKLHNDDHWPSQSEPCGATTVQRFIGCLPHHDTNLPTNKTQPLEWVETTN